jgi:hypothetical protein
VGGVVVHHHLQRPARGGRGDQLEEGQELAVAMPRLAGVGDAAGGHLQGGEQGGGAVAEVVVGAPLDPSWRQGLDRLGAFQRLDLGLLVHPQHDGVGRWVQVQPDHVADLGLQLRIGGELEPLGLPWPEVVLGPDPATVLWLTPSSLASSRQDQWSRRGAQWRGQRRGQDLDPPVTAHGPGAATAGRSASPR